LIAVNAAGLRKRQFAPFSRFFTAAAYADGMLRAWFTFIIVAGILSAMIGHRPASHASSAEQNAFAAAAAAQDGSGPPSNEPDFTVGDGAIELQRQPDSHFYADVRINGAPVHMLVDTGASMIALSREDAQSAGLATSIGMPGVVGEGADGEVHGEYVRLENVELGPLSAQGLDAVVLNAGAQSLLGQEFLSKFKSVEIHGDTMVLRSE
jgi:aspartyl protease family protein